MRQGAVVILKNGEGAVLMQHRDNKPDIAMPGYWGLPSGGVEEGEEPKQAAIRELEEEAGYKLDADDLVFLLQASQEISGRGEIMRSIYYAPYDPTQEIKCLEGKEMRFVDPAEFSSMKVFGDHVQFVNEAEGMLSRNIERKG